MALEALLRLWRIDLLLDVKYRAVLIYPSNRRFGVPVRDIVFRRYNPFDDSIGRSGPMAANAEDAAASVRILDQQDRIPVGSPTLVTDIVIERAGRLIIRELPIRESRHPVRPASGRHPSAILIIPSNLGLRRSACRRHDADVAQSSGDRA